MSAAAPARRAPDRIRAGLAALSLAGLAAGCVLSPSRPQNETVRYPSWQFEESQPADVAVLPPRDRSASGRAPVEPLRRELYAGIVEHLYSPLDVEFVDAHWTEAGFQPDALQAGALLRVVVTEWDLSLFDTHGAVLASATVEMLDGARPSAEPLWGIRIRRRIELASERPRHTEEELWERAAEILAEEILHELPRRDPVTAADGGPQG